MVRSAIMFGLIATLAFAAGCRDREISAYRAPKDPASTVPAEGRANTNDLPPGHPPVGPVAPGAGDTMANTAVPTASGALTWTAPAHWSAKPASAMRKGSFAVKGDGAEADLSITAFPGDTGGLLANLNRWRGQVALPAFAESDLPKSVEHIDTGTLHFEVVDFAGTANGAPTRIVGAILARNGETWFFKLMGPDAVVAKEKPEFIKFLGTVQEVKP
jgi:hypothetical protein